MIDTLTRKFSWGRGLVALALVGAGCRAVRDGQGEAGSEDGAAVSGRREAVTTASGSWTREGSSARAPRAVGQDDMAAGDSAASGDDNDRSGETTMGSVEKLQLSEAEWRERLSPEAFRILRKKGTERAFTGKYWDSKAEGTYACAGCGLPLFASRTKFESGTGWPSFWAPIENENVDEEEDNGFFMRRTEVLCARCGGHLGHVFDDGPAPTYQRYCINGNALDLVDSSTPESSGETSSESSDG